jgi:hypothetical protein
MFSSDKIIELISCRYIRLHAKYIINFVLRKVNDSKPSLWLHNSTSEECSLLGFDTVCLLNLRSVLRLLVTAHVPSLLIFSP